MKKLLLILALLVSATSFAASPTLSLSCNRTSGVAPLAVVCDPGVADADDTYPYLTVLVQAIYGDSTAGTWSTGAAAGSSKNFSSGPVLAHVYETAGSYTITVVATDSSGNTTRATQAITVTDPDTVFSGTATVCVANGASPVAGSNGCPSGAATANQANWHTIVSTYRGATKRILLRKGDTFTSDGAQLLSSFTVGDGGAADTVGYIGAYGTGAAPIIAQNSTEGLMLKFNSTADDWRVVGLDFTCSNSGAGATAIENASADNITISRTTARNCAVGISGGGSGYAVYESTIGPVGSFTGTVGYGIILGGTNDFFALLGSTINLNSTTLGVHGMRTAHLAKSVLGNSTIYAAKFTALDLQAPAFVATNYTEKVLVTGNYIIGNGVAAGIAGFGAGDGVDGRIRYTITERNLFEAGSSTSEMFQYLPARSSVFRNNVITSASNNSMVAVNIGWGTGTLAAPEAADIFIYNNTAYTTSNLGFSFVDTNRAGVTAVTVKNNLGYAPNATKNGNGGGSAPTITIDSGSCGCITASNNTGDSGSFTTSPSFTNTASAPQGFAITGSSYADNGGTAAFPATASDFNHCKDKNGHNPIGAFALKTHAICRSAP